MIHQLVMIDSWEAGSYVARQPLSHSARALSQQRARWYSSPPRRHTRARGTGRGEGPARWALRPRQRTPSSFSRSFAVCGTAPTSTGRAPPCRRGGCGSQGAAWRVIGAGGATLCRAALCSARRGRRVAPGAAGRRVARASACWPSARRSKLGAPLHACGPGALTQLTQPPMAPVRARCTPRAAEAARAPPVARGAAWQRRGVRVLRTIRPRGASSHDARAPARASTPPAAPEWKGVPYVTPHAQSWYAVAARYPGVEMEALVKANPHAAAVAAHAGGMLPANWAILVPVGTYELALEHDAPCVLRGVARKGSADRTSCSVASGPHIPSHGATAMASTCAAVVALALAATAAVRLGVPGAPPAAARRRWARAETAASTPSAPMSRAITMRLTDAVQRDREVAGGGAKSNGNKRDAAPASPREGWSRGCRYRWLGGGAPQAEGAPHKPQAVEPQRQPFGGGGAEYWPARPAPTRAECKLYEGFIKHCSGPDHKPSTVRWWHLNDDIIRP